MNCGLRENRCLTLAELVGCWAEQVVKNTKKPPHAHILTFHWKKDSDTKRQNSFSCVWNCKLPSFLFHIFSHYFQWQAFSLSVFFFFLLFLITAILKTFRRNRRNKGTRGSYILSSFSLRKRQDLKHGQRTNNQNHVWARRKGSNWNRETDTTRRTRRRK